jgi:hypothetical protein
VESFQTAIAHSHIGKAIIIAMTATITQLVTGTVVIAVVKKRTSSIAKFANA